MADVDTVRTKYERLRAIMDERVARLWAASEAMVLGRGGIATVVKATGMSKSRIRSGIAELLACSESPEALDKGARIRRPGAGRPTLVSQDPTLVEDLDKLVEPTTRGDPMSPLRWTTKSKERLANELQAQGHKVSATMVGRLLSEMGYSLQSMRKTKEGSQSPDRDAQFQYINRTAKRFMAHSEPVVSVDTKKKELVGDFKNAGAEWQPKGKPVKTQVHDFVDPQLGKAIPYGVYDTARNEAWVSVGIDHDTAEFAVATLEKWWEKMGKAVYPDAKRLMVVADSGGSNGPRIKLWRVELQRFADATGLDVSVSHLPPGTSKWNKIEHRLFAQITQNWRGRALESREAIVELIRATTTTTGLRVKADLDTSTYQLKKKVSNQQLSEVSIRRKRFRGDWNYIVKSTKKER